MAAITLPREKSKAMRHEMEALRESPLYRRLLAFERNIARGRRYGRKDLGF